MHRPVRNLMYLHTQSRKVGSRVFPMKCSDGFDGRLRENELRKTQGLLARPSEVALHYLTKTPGGEGCEKRNINSFWNMLNLTCRYEVCS